MQGFRISGFRLLICGLVDLRMQELQIGNLGTRNFPTWGFWNADLCLSNLLNFMILGLIGVGFLELGVWGT